MLTYPVYTRYVDVLSALGSASLSSAHTNGLFIFKDHVANRTRMYATGAHIPADLRQREGNYKGWDDRKSMELQTFSEFIKILNSLNLGEMARDTPRLASPS